MAEFEVGQLFHAYGGKTHVPVVRKTAESIIGGV